MPKLHVETNKGNMREPSGTRRTRTEDEECAEYSRKCYAVHSRPLITQRNRQRTVAYVLDVRWARKGTGWEPAGRATRSTGGDPGGIGARTSVAALSPGRTPVEHRRQPVFIVLSEQNTKHKLTESHRFGRCSKDSTYSQDQPERHRAKARVSTKRERRMATKRKRD